MQTIDWFSVDVRTSNTNNLKTIMLTVYKVKRFRFDLGACPFTRIANVTTIIPK